MIIHHLNCSTLCPIAGRFACGPAGKMVCHCLLLETAEGLVLVDTGFGTRDIAEARSRLGGLMLAVGRPKLDPEEAAINRVRKLGFSPEDVRHIVVTHLDLDHAGGLADFPRARVHVYAAEHDAAMARKTFLERERYKPFHWEHGPDWQTYEGPSGAQGESWFGFEAVRDLKGLPPEVLLIPLPGHTRGHCGVAIRAKEGWLLHAGDAYFHYQEMNGERPSCPPGLAMFQRIIEIDHRRRLENQARLRQLANDPSAGVRVFCAHDHEELARFSPRVIS